VTVEHMILVAVAICFVVVTGANDGSAVLSTGISLSTLRTTTSAVILVGLVVIVPVVLGTKVAVTFTERLVNFERENAALLMSIAVISAVMVVGLLTLLGLPTSLTLAVIGGIVGVGLGAGLAVSWSMVVLVLAVGLAAPILGAALAYLVLGVLRLVPPARQLPGVMQMAHRIMFTVQCIAYSLNDAQKMLAVLAIAFGIGLGGPFDLDPLLLAVMGGGFALGMVVGLPSVGMKLSRGLYTVRMTQTVAAEFAAATAVLASAFVGVPVSMTQSLSGGLVGAGVGSGSARVRWKVAMGLSAAWIVTLPASLTLGLVGALLLNVVRT